MDFIVPGIIAFLSIPFFLLYGAVVGGTGVGIVRLLLRKTKSEKADSIRNTAMMVAATITVFAGCVGPICLFFLPFVLYDLSQQQAVKNASTEAQQFVDWFSTKETELYDMENESDPKFIQLKKTLANNRITNFQIGPKHDGVRELAIDKTGSSSLLAKDIAQAATAKELKHFIIGFTFEPPPLDVTADVRNANGKWVGKADSQKVYFTAQRNKKSGGIDLNIYTDYHVPRDKEYGITPVDDFLFKYLHNYDRKCMMDMVHIMPMRKMPTHAKPGAEPQTIDKIQAKFDKLSTATEKSIKNDVFTKTDCIDYYPAAKDRDLGPMFEKQMVRLNTPWSKKRPERAARRLEIDPDCA